MRLRLATLADTDILEFWDRQPHVIYATGDNEAYDWPYELSRNVSWREFLIAEDSERAIGLVVIIDPLHEETHYWGTVSADVKAIDIWIGEEKDTGMGYGQQMMRLACDKCFSDPTVNAIIIDPLASNTAAIRFYERLAFKFVERRMFGSNDIHVMRLDREDWRT